MARNGEGRSDPPEAVDIAPIDTLIFGAMHYEIGGLR